MPIRTLTDGRTRRILAGETLYDAIGVGGGVYLAVHVARLAQAQGWLPGYMIRDGDFHPVVVFVALVFAVFYLGWGLLQQYLITFTEAGIKVPRLRGSITVPWSSIKRIRMQRRQFIWILQLIADDTVVKLRAGYYDDLPGLVSFLHARAPAAQFEGF